jgi:hypothetical protein
MMILLTEFLCKIYSLGLNQNPVSIQALLDSNIEADTSDVKIVWRNRRDSPTGIKPRSVLADTMCYSGDAVVNMETGFYIVEPDESIIFISSAATSDHDGKLHSGLYDNVHSINSFFRISGGTRCSPWHCTVF